MIQIRSTLTAVLAGLALLCSAAPALSASAADIKAQIGETDADFRARASERGKNIVIGRFFVVSQFARRQTCGNGGKSSRQGVVRWRNGLSGFEGQDESATGQSAPRLVMVSAAGKPDARNSV